MSYASAAVYVQDLACYVVVFEEEYDCGGYILGSCDSGHWYSVELSLFCFFGEVFGPGYEARRDGVDADCRGEFLCQ